MYLSITASILRRPQLWPAHAALLGIEVETREPSSDDASDDYEDSDGDEEVNPLLLDPTQWKVCVCVCVCVCGRGYLHKIGNCCVFIRQLDVSSVCSV